MKKLIHGDNLPMMKKHIDDKIVDLCYLDPPFNSNVNYSSKWVAPTGSIPDVEHQEFTDIWSWNDFSIAPTEFANLKKKTDDTSKKLVIHIQSMLDIYGTSNICAYIVYMATRLVEIYRVLKDTGSIYLHCDPTASHELRKLLDIIFGVKNFRNEIVWHYPEGQSSSKWFGKKHDVILFYSKSKSWTFNEKDILTPYTEKELARFNQIDDDGRAFYWNKNKTAGRYKIYHKKTGKNPTDVWILPIAHGKERFGYPTQKPLALLDRIIKTSSNPGDIVFDPFCGSGTTIAAAEKLGRNYIGIDKNKTAYTITDKRVGEFDNVSGIKEKVKRVYEVNTIEDVRKKADADWEWFEEWAVKQLGGQWIKGGNENGIDGHRYLDDNRKLPCAISVKTSANKASVRELMGAVGDKDLPYVVGILACLSASSGMRKKFRNQGNIRNGLGHIQKFQIYDLNALWNLNNPDEVKKVGMVKLATLEGLF